MSRSSADPTQYTSRPPASSIRRAGLARRCCRSRSSIKADVGLEIAFADCGGWDTHVEPARARPAGRPLREWASHCTAFNRDLGERMNDVVVLTMSEFGRTIRENGDSGTDHGHATAMLALGGPVNGGRVLGEWPELGSSRAALEGQRRRCYDGLLPRPLRGDSGAAPGITTNLATATVCRSTADKTSCPGDWLATTVSVRGRRAGRF